MLGHIALGDLADVVALIALLGNLARQPAGLANARLHAVREIHDLAARVVVVELAAHAPAGPLEQRRDRITERGLPAVADVQRARGVCRHEFDVDGCAAANVALSIIRTRRENRGERADDLRVGEEKVDEAGSRDLGLTHQAGRQLQ